MQDPHEVETKRLRDRVQTLEKENRDLRRSVFELNLQISQMWRRPAGSNASPSPSRYDIDLALAETNTTATSTAARPGALAQTASLAHELRGSPRQNPSRGNRGKQGLKLSLQGELIGHTGSIYAVQYSPSGGTIATASLDKTAILWDSERMTSLCTLKGHDSVLSDLSWSEDGTQLLTGSFDSTVRLWQAEGGAAVFTRPVGSLVHSVAWCSDEPSVFLAATSDASLHICDTRDAASGAVLENGAPISTIFALPNDAVLTGDSTGAVKAWDLRQRKCICASIGSAVSAEITHIGSMPKGSSADAGRYVAVTAQDNTVRVYERSGTFKPDSMRLLCTGKGHSVRNWPIRCSVFQADANPSSAARLNFGRTKSGVGAVYPDDGSTGRGSGRMASTVLVAVGSADNEVRLYDGSGSESLAPVVQQLPGHTGRVYGVHFHPHELALASCSEDGTARIWGV